MNATQQVAAVQGEEKTTLRFRPEGLDLMRSLPGYQGIATDAEFAARIGINPGQFSRVNTGKAAPGPGFISGVVRVFGLPWFLELFEIIPDDRGLAA